MDTYELSKQLCYIHSVNAKKALMDVEVQRHAAQSRNPQGMRLFYLCPSFGGSSREAQASPVTHRVSRSSTPVRAAALI